MGSENGWLSPHAVTAQEEATGYWALHRDSPSQTRGLIFLREMRSFPERSEKKDERYDAR